MNNNLDDRIIYQTLENRNNREFVNNNGPFPCKKNNAWLGEGFYFWEYYIENAHWWGEGCNSYQNGYIICEAKYTYNNEKCFDLLNYIHKQELLEIKEEMICKGIFTSNDVITVARLIAFMKLKKIFNFEAIRAYGINSKSLKSKYSNHVFFNENNKDIYLELKPPIQICFLNKKSLNLRNYKVIFESDNENNLYA